MKFFNTAARNIALAASMTVFFAVSGAAFAASAAADTTAQAGQTASAERKAEMEKHRQEFFKHMSDRMANRLEIKSSQQAAFQTYAAALQTAMTPPASRPEYGSDAAGIVRMHADMAAERAKRLAAVADATAKFQDVLSPDQRKTFDQMAAAFMRRHHGMHQGMVPGGGHEHGWGGEHDRQGGRGWGRDGGAGQGMDDSQPG
ncbi:MAG TPA: Spy/CpxP family protein refolding chaperone [Burkholderiaceae bacterium]